jgi:hypothetical protein
VDQVWARRFGKIDVGHKLLQIRRYKEEGTIKQVKKELEMLII